MKRIPNYCLVVSNILWWRHGWRFSSGNIIKELFDGFKCTRAVIWLCCITINIVLCCGTHLSHFERRYPIDIITLSGTAELRETDSAELVWLTYNGWIVFILNIWTKLYAECGKSATGILRNDSTSPFRKIPVADFPHSAFFSIGHRPPLPPTIAVFWFVYTVWWPADKDLHQVTTFNQWRHTSAEF